MILAPTTQISLKTQMEDFAAYNQWANKTLIDWLKTKPVEVFTQNIPSSFPTLQKTLMHIWDVEQGWMGRLQDVPTKSFTWEGFDGTLEDIIEGLLEQSENTALYVQSLTEEELMGDCFFSIPYVGDHTVLRYEILQHSFCHSIYHRGQVITMGRNLGFTDAPMTDYMFYLLRVKRAIND